MKIPSTLVVLSLPGMLASPTKRQAGTGTGPYPAGYTTDSGLPGHTIYAPKATPPAGVTLPVLLWGEGACTASGTIVPNFLTEIASHGFMVVASGAPGGSGTTTSRMMLEAISFIAARAGTSGRYARVDASRVAAAGHSCGGLEALDMKDEARVGHIGVFNSGYLQATERAATIRKPVFYLLGGTSDAAYPNGERDYKNLPAGTPSWKGNLPVGHGATYSQPNGGKFGVAVVKWLQWTLKGNATAASWFVDGKAQKDGWAVQSKNLDKIKV